MPEYSEADVNRLAEMTEGLASTPCSTVAERLRLARHLLDRGVTLPPPPPDPAVVVAEAISDAWADDESTQSVLRHLFPTDALEAAAAKVQEADR